MSYCEIFNKKLNEGLILEASNQDFLLFVIKYLSYDKEHWQNEWVYDGRYKRTAQCVCGKEGIETVYVVRNEVTNKVLAPIGSVCIEHFSNNIIKQIQEELNSSLLNILLRNSDSERSLLAMSKKFFSKKDLQKIEAAGVITSDEKEVCLKALNKRSARLDDFMAANDILMEKIVPALRRSINAAVSSSSAVSEDVYFDSGTREFFETIYKFSKKHQADVFNIENFLFSVMNSQISSHNGGLSESVLSRKRMLYNELRVIDSYHCNFYEARIASKAGKKYLVLENHLEYIDGEKDYSERPLEINIFELKPEINYIDEVLEESDFYNNFSNLPEPQYSFSSELEYDIKFRH